MQVLVVYHLAASYHACHKDNAVSYVSSAKLLYKYLAIISQTALQTTEQSTLNIAIR